MYEIAAAELLVRPWPAAGGGACGGYCGPGPPPYPGGGGGGGGGYAPPGALAYPPGGVCGWLPYTV